MKQEHVLSCQVARYLRMRGYVTLDCDVMSALKYLPAYDARNRSMFVASRKAMSYTLGQCDIVCINKYGNVSFLELKNGKAGKQSENQKYFEQEIKCRGGNYVLIRDFDDCIKFVNEDLCEPVAQRIISGAYAPKIISLDAVTHSAPQGMTGTNGNNDGGAESQMPDAITLLGQE